MKRQKFNEKYSNKIIILLLVSNSKIGGQGTLATVLIGVSRKQLHPSNCPGQ
jgi:hypothetical protein